MATFLACGLRVASATRFPGTGGDPGRGPADLVFRVEAARPLPPAGRGMVPLAFRDRKDPEVSVGRARGGRVLRFRGLAVFLVSADGTRVAARPAPGVPGREVRRLFLDQVLPCVLAFRGRTVLHASCVAEGGRAVALVGASGAGKSTLAAALAREGFAILADDALVVEDAGGNPRAIPARARTCPGPVPLRRIHVLAPAGRRRPGRPSIRTLRPREALVALVDQSYRLDPSDRGRIREEFESLARSPLLALARRLTYPLGVENLPAVVRAVAEDLREA